MLYLLITAVLTIGILVWVARRMEMRPNRVQTAVEWAYDLTKRLQLAVEIDNLFDHHYYTAGQLANTGVTAQGAVTTRPFPAYTTGPFAGSFPAQSAIFYAPGAPLRAWVELRLRF